MNAPAYDTLLGLLDAAKLTLASQAGDLSPADLRIRCLVNITANETQRALLETVSCRPRHPEDAARATPVEEGVDQPASRDDGTLPDGAAHLPTSGRDER